VQSKVGLKGQAHRRAGGQQCRALQEKRKQSNSSSALFIAGTSNSRTLSDSVLHQNPRAQRCCCSAAAVTGGGLTGSFCCISQHRETWSVGSPKLLVHYTPRMGQYAEVINRICRVLRTIQRFADNTVLFVCLLGV
jgi:hypothetical protein